MKRIVEFMKRNYKVILLITALSAILWSFVPSEKKEDPEKDKLLLELLTFVLEKGHYSPIELNDDFSKKVYKKYLENIDPTKRFFIQSDMDDFSKYETSIDDMIKSKDITFFNLTNSRLLQRMKESREIYENVLSKPFDFNSKETINVDYDKLPVSKNKSELVERWRKQLKLSALSSITDKQKLEEDKHKDDASYEMKSFEVIEKEVRESSLKSLNEYFDFIEKELDRDDWFAIFLNSIVERFDPHTFYFSPDDKEKFDVSMSGTFQGIGARLQKKETGVEISELISGGPAWRGKELEAGDLILKVAQGKEEPLDIAGMRLDDVVKKIKGPKGTEVRLTVKKVDGTIKVISIIRDEVETEETFAKSSVVEKEGKKYGIIYLPKFYISFENKENRDAFKDVAAEIEKLKAQNIDGLIMDLRDNGGGSLETVVKMVGLFIPDGPIVQVKAPGRNPEILPDPDKKVQYDGPLVVMINNFSASASEIFAAAIQDYKRGIVVGSKHSYGKGTVQNVIDLNQFIRGNSFGDLGALKTTIQKFYRINGGSTQREGVKSDIVFPDRFAYLDMGERDEESALPWDKIAPAKYEPLNINYDNVIANSKKRIATNNTFKLIDENAKWIYERKDENVISLNLIDFNKEIAIADAKIKKFKQISEYNNKFQFQSLPDELALFENDTLLKQKRERWHEEMQKDVYIEETLNVIADIKLLTKGKSLSQKLSMN
ncbi:MULTISPECIES: carboxy terminal-processing peptidase [unclassified Flavobacterium]|uniref:carboxy terminal-processing peptidase n=1 Tax=unclassified Flavobacterium TaxID=196869 RepID=UPI0012913282|nr:MULTISPECIES: carboxy terminal-processing peptidase [unclassified Flavobacterium]MQP52638.1 tail-specific protease [Flavobacterium sp. LMO9]MQP62182.1 tail-specific protease [Flavobacterium sp. LMO6]